MKKDKRSKMQRQAQSQRKTWTNKERFDRVQKNREKLALVARQEHARQLLADAEQEMMTEAPSSNNNNGVIEGTIVSSPERQSREASDADLAST